MIKGLIKSRNFRFLHPDVVAKANEAELSSILKAVSYFRNLAIFKSLYTLLFKGSNLTVAQYKSIYDMLVDYKAHHPRDYFVKGFSSAIMRSSTIHKSTKAVYAIMIYDQLFDDAIFSSIIHKSSRRFTKAVSNYYLNNRAVRLAVIKKTKVSVINNSNLIKSIIRWNP
jgi:hypothetical protein